MYCTYMYIVFLSMYMYNNLHNWVLSHQCSPQQALLIVQIDWSDSLPSGSIHPSGYDWQPEGATKTSLVQLMYSCTSFRGRGLWVPESTMYLSMELDQFSVECSGSCTSIQYRIALIFHRSKFLRIAVFDILVFLKIHIHFKAGDGAKCQNFRWNNFANGIKFVKIAKILTCEI